MADNKLASKNVNKLFGRPVTGIDPSDVQQLMELDLERKAQGLNLSRPEYTQGITEINAYTPGQGNPYAAGFVASKDPSVVNIYPWGRLNNYVDVLAHEASHTANMLANRQVSRDKKNDTFYEALARQAALDRSLGYTHEIQKNFKEYNKNAKEWLGAYADRNASWDERMADFQALEAQLPKGKTLLDTPMGQAVFNTPELKQYWLESSIPLAIKAIPQSPQYKNLVLDKIRQFNDLFQDEAKTTGYAQAALKAIYKSATTPVENPKYK